MSILQYFTKFHRDPVTLASLGILFFCVLTYFVDPTKTALFPPCPFFVLTGIYCPGCGSLRASHKLLHGELLSALDYNTLFVLSMPIVLLLLVIEVFHLNPFRKFYSSPILPMLTLALVLTFWIVRNLGAYPFNILAP